MKKDYLVVETSISNGFPYDTIIGCGLTKDEASLIIRNKVSEYMAENNPEPDSDDIINNEEYFVVNDGKGNGYSVFVYSESELMDHIMSEVDLSDDTMEYEYIGVDSAYKMDAKVLNFIGSPVVDGGDGGYYYKVEYVIRRPYDPEQPQDGEYIYDVHMLRYDGLEFNRANEPITPEEYVESLEEVPLSVLVNIYNN